METSSLIIRLNNSPDEIEQRRMDETSLFDATFLIAGNTQLQINVPAVCDKAVEYLDHAVTRTQNDLRSHVQRIFLHVDRKDADAVYGALLDLFLILKERGRPLRERMLKVSRSSLAEERHRFLEQHLKTGIRASDPIPPSRSSLFSKGLSGSNSLVIKLETRGNSQQNPLDEARDYLEYGQVDEARQVLEAAILRDPRHPSLHHDLLEIYRHTKAKDAFLAMRRRIDPDTNPTADAWQELAALFAEEN